MKLLIDTQCWLWLNTAAERFSRERRRQLERADTALLLTAASAWEIAIKFALGKLALPERPAEYVPSRMRLTRTAPLPVIETHALQVAELPPLHRDPFDRLIIAQAQIERLPILTADPQTGEPARAEQLGVAPAAGDCARAVCHAGRLAVRLDGAPRAGGALRSWSRVRPQER